jgi:Holliday junction DNA helicase RuvA
MINYLEGKLIQREPALLVLDVNGVGYELRISLNTFSSLKQNEGKCKLFTYLHITENAHTLYGFSESTEKQIFLHLISVSGVGPSTALMALSSLTAIELQEAIATEDTKKIQSIKGVGAKTAQRIVLELKDKIQKEILLSPQDNAIKSNKKYNPDREDALSALITLGLPKATAEKNLEDVIKKFGENLSVEEMIRKALN